MTTSVDPTTASTALSSLPLDDRTLSTTSAGACSTAPEPVASMRNLEIAMRAAGVTWDQIVRRTIYTTRPHEYEVISRAIAEVTGQTEDFPAQTILGVTGLAIPGLLVEIECTAVS